ncbi:MAG: hypothetical protein JXR37_23560 [Kiritimatiellae bacterium]|nr:hypothetical protein [Kiritimatiellia bacterium]
MRQRESGMVLVVVLCIVMLLSVLVASFWKAAASQLLMAQNLHRIEQAEYLAEAGTQFAAAYLYSGGTAPYKLSGTFGEGECEGKYYATITTNTSTKDTIQHTIVASGTLQNVTRKVRLSGCEQLSWAKYAMWMDINGKVYFVNGERVYGPTHGNDKLYFSGAPDFYGAVTSAADGFGGTTNQCIFRQGFSLNEPEEHIANVDFNDLRTQADIIINGDASRCQQVYFTGNSYYTVPGYVSNALPPNAVVYVKQDNTSNPHIYVEVRGQVSGRVTLVSDGDIRIMDHLTYKEPPWEKADSEDMLGLIAKRDIAIYTSAPKNLQVHGHLMATGQRDDRGYVYNEDWNGDSKGDLTLFGGIVQKRRGTIGTYSPSSGVQTGFRKNYYFDRRLMVDPPPNYPQLPGLVFGQWDDA